MRLPAPGGPDQFLVLQGRRVDVHVAGQRIRGRLLSVRDGFLTVDPDRGPRISINKYEVSSISEEQRPVSRCPKITRMFWK
jgi:hypothetical protein